MHPKPRENNNPVEILHYKSEIQNAAGISLYRHTLKDKLNMYISALPEERKDWTVDDLDNYIKDYILEQILAKEYPELDEESGRTKRIPLKKELIVNISRTLNFSPLAIETVYEELEGEFLGDQRSRYDSKDYIMTNILNQIATLDDLIEIAPSDSKKNNYLTQKLKWMEFLAKLEKLTEKAGTQVFSVGGNMSVSSTSNVDKQVNISQSEQNKYLHSLMQKYITPIKKPIETNSDV